MNNTYFKRAIKTLQLVAFILLPNIMFAPPIPPGPGGSTPITPIDNGIIILLVAGLSLGMYSLHKMKSTKKAI